AWQAGGAVVVLQFDEAGCRESCAPAFQVVVAAVARAVPAFLILTTRVGAEQHAAGLECRVQLAKHARQVLLRHVEQAGVGEDAIEMRGWQIQFEKALLPHLAAAVGLRHGDELGATVEADGLMAEPAEGAQVAPRTAAEIENAPGLLTFDM